MGTLVFQATLGGAVNIIGPNIASTINFTLPSADGSSGQALTTNGSGTLAFSSVVSGAAGSTTQVQYNSSGAFAGSANLTFNGTTLTAAGLAGPFNGTVGATTANTGNFTTLTTSSTITDNGGTANGVTYLNGSKVVTSGSALTFDGTLFVAPRVMASTSGYTVNSANTQLGIYNGTGYVQTPVGGTLQIWDAATNPIMSMTSSAIISYISNAEQMRLNSTGLGIGTSSPSKKLEVSSSSNTLIKVVDTTGTVNNFFGNFGGFGYVGMGTNHALGIYTNDTLRATFDASGNLLVGTTNSSVSVGEGIKLLSDASRHLAIVSSQSTNAAGESLLMYSSGASAYRFYVGWGGTVYATSTTITAISDQRLKENIRDLDEGLATVMALKPRKFDWKEGKGQNIKNARGFIAQEFETVLPDMIEEWRDPAPEGEEAYKAINANLIPTLVKAMQEQQAIIESLKARLDAANL